LWWNEWWIQLNTEYRDRWASCFFFQTDLTRHQRSGHQDKLHKNKWLWQAEPKTLVRTPNPTRNMTISRIFVRIFTLNSCLCNNVLFIFSNKVIVLIDAALKNLKNYFLIICEQGYLQQLSENCESGVQSLVWAKSLIPWIGLS